MMDSDTRIHLLDNEIDLVNDEASTKHDKAGEKRKRKETSKWWPFFERVTDESGQRKAKCKAYGHVQNAPSNYGANNLKKHVMRCSKLNDPNYNHCLTEEEWERVEKISKFLSVFYDVTCLFSGTKYPTSNLYFQKVFFANLKLRQNMESSDEYMKDMSTSMWLKFAKYWYDFSTILSIATVVDPRYKLHFVEFAYRKIYGSDPRPMNSINETLTSLFNEYKAKDPSSSSTPTSSHVRDTLDANENLSNEDKEVMEEYLTLGSDVVMTDEESQLQLYLEEPRPQWTENFDILEFWKGYQYRYPEVAVFACDILSISISMVASESAFSVGGRVIDRFRSTLKPDYVEALICTRDWLFGESAINATIKLDELNEDLTNLSISEMVESTGTISSAME